MPALWGYSVLWASRRQRHSAGGACRSAQRPQSAAPFQGLLWIVLTRFERIARAHFEAGSQTRNGDPPLRSRLRDTCGAPPQHDRAIPRKRNKRAPIAELHKEKDTFRRAAPIRYRRAHQTSSSGWWPSSWFGAQAHCACTQPRIPRPHPPTRPLCPRLPFAPPPNPTPVPRIPRRFHLKSLSGGAAPSRAHHSQPSQRPNAERMPPTPRAHRIPPPRAGHTRWPPTRRPHALTATTRPALA